MKAGIAIALMLLASAALDLRAQDDLPSAADIEPPILVPNRDTDGLPVPTAQTDPVKLESDLARAKRSAAAGERLFRAGIISQVESEERASKVVRLEAELAEARLAAVRTQLVEQQTQGEMAAAQLSALQSAVTEAARVAEQTLAERRRAEVEAAARNLARQRKLLALGSARRSDVSRAEKKLAELKNSDR